MFDKLFHEAAVASLTTMEQNAYAESQKQYLYYVNSLKLAKQQGEHVGKHIGLKIGFQQGHEKGFEEGHEKGFGEGHEKGFEEGRNSEREKIIQAMKEQGLSDEAIATILQTAQNKE